MEEHFPARSTVYLRAPVGSAPTKEKSNQSKTGKGKAGQRCVAHKPFLCQAFTSLPAPPNSPWPFRTELTLTLAVKASPDPIKRHANESRGVSVVYFVPATELDDTGEREGKKFNRRNAGGKVGQKGVSDTAPPQGGEFMELRGESADAFLYINTTKGGTTAGRFAQTYAHLKEGAIYSLSFPAHMYSVALRRLSYKAYEHEGWQERNIDLVPSPHLLPPSSTADLPPPPPPSPSSRPPSPSPPPPPSTGAGRGPADISPVFQFPRSEGFLPDAYLNSSHSGEYHQGPSDGVNEGWYHVNEAVFNPKFHMENPSGPFQYLPMLAEPSMLPRRQGGGEGFHSTASTPIASSHRQAHAFFPPGEELGDEEFSSDSSPLSLAFDDGTEVHRLRQRSSSHPQLQFLTSQVSPADQAHEVVDFLLPSLRTEQDFSMRFSLSLPPPAVEEDNETRLAMCSRVLTNGRQAGRGLLRWVEESRDAVTGGGVELELEGVGERVFVMEEATDGDSDSPRRC